MLDLFALFSNYSSIYAILSITIHIDLLLIQILLGNAHAGLLGSGINISIYEIEVGLLEKREYREARISE